MSTKYAGQIKFGAYAAAPLGHALCDGSAVSRTSGGFADTFAAIGTAYGVGNGSTTFNLPDFRDRVVVGDGTTRDRGDTGGATTDSVTLVANNIPVHTHAAGTHTHPLGAHIHALGQHDHAHTHTHSHSHGPSGGGNFVKHVGNNNGGLAVATGGTDIAATDTDSTGASPSTTSQNSAGDDTGAMNGSPTATASSGTTGNNTTTGAAFSVATMPPFGVALAIVKL